MAEIMNKLEKILTPETLRAVYRVKYPYEKGQLPSGAVVGKAQFRPEYGQKLYDIIYHDVLLPMSKMSLNSLLEVDLTKLLPEESASDYPEQSLGLITILDQTRILTTGYAFRYTRAFFDPLCEKLARQLVSLPIDVRPDGKTAWLSRGYSFDDWLIRTLWFWAPLVHSDEFMVEDRRTLKRWLHSMRAEVEAHAGVSDPFAPIEAEDDVDINAFQRIEDGGPPAKGYSNPRDEATIADYSFWWIRILNSHFAITDMCGHYPYWTRWKGFEWTDEDKEFMKQTKNYRYDLEDEPIFQEVRKDFLAGYWKPMQPNPEYEEDAENGNKTTSGTASRQFIKAYAGRSGMPTPPGSSMMHR